MRRRACWDGNRGSSQHRGAFGDGLHRLSFAGLAIMLDGRDSNEEWKGVQMKRATAAARM